MTLLTAQYTSAQLCQMYRQMLLIRLFEEKAAEMYTKGHISGFSHLYIGQEAVAVGVTSMLSDKDYLITAYREHGQAIAKGCDPKEVMAELFGKATGLCGGKGGSMHLFDPERRFMGGYAIVAGQLPIAVGLGLSVSYRQLWNLPVIFICENNQYGMGTAVHRANASADIAGQACAYRMPGLEANGMDVLDVANTMQEALRHIQTNLGPVLIEAKTYRFRGHSMADPLKYRTAQEEEIWKSRDPIPALANVLTAHYGATAEELEAIRKAVTQEVDAAVAFAQESPFPGMDTLMQNIYTPNEFIDSTGALIPKRPDAKAYTPEPDQALAQREQLQGQE
ncbi:MAG: pyruvate dehydrogenase [Vampirovibrio sp.]|nr:pyruvate dehydrogenase [Vampirovibrio sp.]